jgi:carboxylesterase type B
MPSSTTWLTCLVLWTLGAYAGYAQSSETDPESSMPNNNDSPPVASRPVVVHLPGLGKVQGRREGPIDFFGGLPYAAPPVGDLRWAPPEVRGLTWLVLALS